MTAIRFLIFLILPFTLISQEIPIKKLEAMNPRNIGPAGMSGRVTSIDVLKSNKNVIYVGTASGGLWRSTSGGIKWDPIFDKEKVHSVGVVKVQEDNPDVIWVGTGEGNPRNSMSHGAGIYKSVDGGKTWNLMGLEKTKNIHRIVINKHNPDHVIVGATGLAWAESEDRGVFKTTNGGKTWEKVLYKNSITGCADLVQDPRNPNKLIAAMWEHQRWPWFFKSGGKGSGIYVSYDAGDTWTLKDKGLPKGELGRIGLSISYSKPNIVYALVESKKNGIYKSEDGGETWKMVTNKGQFGNRPFYYADIYVDPSNENRIYSIWSVVSMSEDGGKTWEVIMPYGGPNGVHPDHHAWWMDVDDPDYIINGNDGGLNISRDHGNTWRFVENLPVAQFYHINVDNEFPYNVYGGMQDNGSWIGPSSVFRYGGIKNFHWNELSFGDGFDVVPDAYDNRYGYTMSQEGNLYRYDRETGNMNFIKPVHPEGKELRFHWNAALSQDPFDVKKVYYGSQFVHVSVDRGDNWMLMSPDLTTNDTTKQKQLESGGLTYDVTGAENHTCILCIAPSTQETGVIWVGTDDGNIQLTTDQGGNWNNLSGNIKAFPDHPWVPQILPSKHKPGEAFVVVNNYRQGDFKPYLYHTSDYGKNWVNLAANKNIWGYVLSVEQDPIVENLLFMGTEYGLYVSIDKGANWTKWTEGYPTASTMDMKIQEREKDLVIGTFGRSAWIMDDLSPLRKLAQEGLDILNKHLTLLESPTAYMASYRQPEGGRFTASAVFSGENEDTYGLIQYFINKPEIKKEDDKEDNKEDVDSTKKEKYKMSLDSAMIEIYDMAGKQVRWFKTKVDSGLNRSKWYLDSEGVRYPNQRKPEKETSQRGGGMIMPGKYIVKVTYNEQTQETPLEVKYDPRMDFHQADYKKKMEKMDELNSKVKIATEAMDRIREAEKVMKKFVDYTDDESQEKVKELNKEISDSLKTIKKIVNGESGGKQGIFRRPNTLNQNFGNVSYYIQSAKGAPTSNVDYQMKVCDQQLKELVDKTNEFFENDWKKYQEEMSKIQFEIFKNYDPIEIK